jgi:nucleotide-binding universal stress UspA family protein
MSSPTIAAAIGIHRVLIAVAFSEASEKALQHAVAIARSYGARFYLTHVSSSLGFTLADDDAVAMATEVAERDLRSWEQHMATVLV